MKKQISLIIPKNQNQDFPNIFLGVLYLASYLEDKGFNTKIYDEQLNEASENINEIIQDSFLVGFTLMTSQLKSAVTLSKKIHNSGLPVVWGGIHPTLFPEQCLHEKYVDYVVYDAYFRVVPKEFLLKDLDKFINGDYNKDYKASWWTPYSQPRFRVDPVPSTGRKRWRFGHFYRHANTCMQERRANVSAEEFDVYVRPKRGSNYLPDPWDDIPRSDCHIKKSWKKNKKRKQWM